MVPTAAERGIIRLIKWADHLNIRQMTLDAMVRPPSLVEFQHGIGIQTVDKLHRPDALSRSGLPGR